MTSITFFSVLFAIAIRYVRRRAVHKRLLVVAAMIHDRRTAGRVHPACWCAGVALLALPLAP